MYIWPAGQGLAGQVAADGGLHAWITWDACLIEQGDHLLCCTTATPVFIPGNLAWKSHKSLSCTTAVVSSPSPKVSKREPKVSREISWGHTRKWEMTMMIESTRNRSVACKKYPGESQSHIQMDGWWSDLHPSLYAGTFPVCIHDQATITMVTCPAICNVNIRFILEWRNLFTTSVSFVIFIFNTYTIDRKYITLCWIRSTLLLHYGISVWCKRSKAWRVAKSILSSLRPCLGMKS